MEIRNATIEDIDEIMMIYDRARKYMRENNNLDQWKDGYPKLSHIIDDINDAISYVCLVGNEIEAVFVKMENGDPTYDYIDGSWLNDYPYIALHRVASKGTYKGVLSEIIDYCFKICTNIRIDTHKDNTIMQHLLEKNGFIKCGIIYLVNGDPRITYHKA